MSVLKFDYRVRKSHKNPGKYEAIVVILFSDGSCQRSVLREFDSESVAIDFIKKF